MDEKQLLKIKRKIATDVRHVITLEEELDLVIDRIMDFMVDYGISKADVMDATKRGIILGIMDSRRSTEIGQTESENA